MTALPPSEAALPSSQPPERPTEALSAAVTTRTKNSVLGIVGSNPVGFLMVLAFVAFVIAYALAGARAAAIAFWAVVLGLPALMFVVSALGAAWRRSRRAEALEIANFVVQLTTPSSTRPAFGLPFDDSRQVPADYPIKGNARTGEYFAPGSSSYNDAVADIWFASEELAEANGFRPAGTSTPAGDIRPRRKSAPRRPTS